MWQYTIDDENCTCQENLRTSLHQCLVRIEMKDGKTLYIDSTRLLLGVNEYDVEVIGSYSATKLAGLLKAIVVSELREKKNLLLLLSASSMLILYTMQ